MNENIKDKLEFLKDQVKEFEIGTDSRSYIKEYLEELEQLIDKQLTKEYQAGYSECETIMNYSSYDEDALRKTLERYD